MGLAMVYGIVTNHSGTVTVDSSPGKGTTFRLRFPIVDAGADRTDSGEYKKLQPGSGRVLIVDDEAGVRQVAGAMLTDLGYEVAYASDGSEAVEYLRSRPGTVDVVVLDLTMPIMDGRTCFYEMRRLDPGIRVVIATGHALEGTAEELIADGALRYVQKPFIQHQLGSAIAKALKPRNDSSSTG
jgi:DNA-binding NtrC family response regulator